MSVEATAPPAPETVSVLPPTDTTTKNVETAMQQEETQQQDLKRTADQAQLETTQPSSTNKRPKKRRIIFSPPTNTQSIILLENASPADVVDVVESITIHSEELARTSSRPILKAMALENTQVRIGPDRATIKKIKKEYCDEYNSRPETIRKKELNRNNPDIQKKRQEYAARPEVREKKRLKAKEGRLFKRMAKSLTPTVHDELMSRVRSELHQNDEKSSSSSDSSEESSSHDEEK